MSLAVEKRIRRVSWSHISTYCKCPMQWRLSRSVEPEHTPVGLKLGSAVHEALAAYYVAAQEGRSLELGDLLAVFETAWSKPEDAPLRFGKGEDDAYVKAQAERMLRTFLANVNPGDVMAVELGFTIELSEDIELTGFVDLVERRGETIWVVDHKTSKQLPGAAIEKEQAALYVLALRAIGFIPEDVEVRTRFDVLRRLKTRDEFASVEVVITHKDLADTRNKVLTIARAMDGDIVYRSPSWMCESCRWRQACVETDAG